MIEYKHFKKNSSVNVYVLGMVSLATVAKDAAILFFKAPSCFFSAKDAAILFFF